MLKRTISIAALCLLLTTKSAWAQQTTDSTHYKSRKLKTEEINFVTGYYQQNGNNAAVTGGIGDEHLTDVATTFNLTLGKRDQKLRKHTLAFDLGIDTYTSASSDKIDASTVSSASKSDVRVYPSASYNIQDDDKRKSFGGGVSYSREYDYTSYGGNIQLSTWSKDRNREFTAKASVYLDEWKVILPAELRPPGYGSGSEDDKNPVDYKPRNSYNLGFVYTQVINRNFQLALLADAVYQEGLLGTKFHRVYFTDGSVKTENLPNQRFKIPVGLRASYFLGDQLVLRGFYRYYEDNWQVKSHTISLEVSYKVTPFMSFAPSYRFYQQSAADYFAPYQQHLVSSDYYTSDYDLSKFSSNMYGFNARFSNLNDKCFVKSLNTLEVRYSFYDRSTGLDAHSVTLALKFK